jgi:hypothetical protein
MRTRSDRLADDVSLAGLQVTGEIAIVRLAVGRRHQHLDVLSGDLRGGAAE